MAKHTARHAKCPWGWNQPSIRPVPYNYDTPDWTPLERAVSLAGLPKRAMADYMWMMEEPMGLHHFKHRDTRNYAHLTIDTPEDKCKTELAKANRFSNEVYVR